MYYLLIIQGRLHSVLRRYSILLGNSRIASTLTLRPQVRWFAPFQRIFECSDAFCLISCFEYLRPQIHQSPAYPWWVAIKYLGDCSALERSCKLPRSLNHVKSPDQHQSSAAAPAIL